MKEIYPKAWLLAALLVQAACAQAETRLKVMSFNVWGGGLNDGKSTEQTIAAIRAAGADIIGMQETRAELPPCRNNYCPPHGPSIAKDVADALGYYYHDQHSTTNTLWADAILSRFPLLNPTPMDLGVRIDVDGRTVYLFNIHPSDYPYGPYQLLHIPYEAAPYISTAGEAVRYAQRIRGHAFEMLQQEFASAGNADLMVVTGDFNEPSGRDWTARAVAAGLYPIAVPWPLIASLEAAGFIDTYREAHPDEVANPGFTWPSLTTADATLIGYVPGTDYRDRIDFVFVRGPDVKVSEASLVGETKVMADIVVTPWPSDHRAVLATIAF
jgi:endonuclease/exonuclease/phosphatase family metal-dependent hydrolase